MTLKTVHERSPERSQDFHLPCREMDAIISRLCDQGQRCRDTQ